MGLIVALKIVKICGSLFDKQMQILTLFGKLRVGFQALISAVLVTLTRCRLKHRGPKTSIYLAERSAVQN